MIGMRLLLGFLALAVLFPGAALARVETITVHSPALEGNLEANSADRKVHVILPAGYDKHKRQRYPVVYYLHGYTATADDQITGLDPDEAVQSFAGQPMIVVIPDAFTKRGGGFYASGPVVGNFEHFIARDLVAAIDARFRTIPMRASRGLGGHSMGGHGVLRIGMKHSGVFSVLYPMAPCCNAPRRAAEGDAKYETMDPASATEFADRGYFAYAAALSPNPENPPHYWDLVTSGGKADPMVEARWAAGAPSVFVAQYVPELKSMTAIAMDVGEQDFLLDDVKLMHRELTRFGIAHEFMLFEGDHVNRVKARFRANLLPFFGTHLKGPDK
jgi:S-formylglutathione hydrolase FrmB